MTMPQTNPTGCVTVRKLDHQGREVFRYPGRLLSRDEDVVVLLAGWNRAPMDFEFARFEPGDRWTEYFYANEWYNIFEIRASDGRLKGWYCNVTRPARITVAEVAAEDLALDLWVAPDGAMQVLDVDEFDALLLSPADRAAARGALAQLQGRVTQRSAPFDCLPPVS
jgi:hypothetical protein